MYGWQRECGEEKDRAAQGWQGMLTLPREVSVKDGELLIRPAKEVRNLRGRHALNEEYIVAMYLDFGQHYEVEAMISDGKAEVSFEFLYSPAGSVKLSINEDSLELDKGPYSGGGAKTISRAIARKPKRRLNAFVDGTSLEIFLDRQVALTTRVYPTEESIGFKCFSKATEGITKLDVYKMKDCYAEYENARQNGSKTVRVKHKS
jgi:beta-fructofuranosidase